jgi:mannose-6-phosphate isomerase-like protein (cupin superfamily)
MDRRETLIGLIALATGAAGKATSPAWPDGVISFKENKTEKLPFGELTVYHDGKTNQLKSMITGTLLLYPGKEPHPPHQHPEEEIMIITEGSGTIFINEKNIDVGPGSIMYCEANHLHGVKNTGSAPMRFYYMKWVS